MHKYFALTLVTIKSSLGAGGTDAKKRRTTIILYAILLLAFVPTAGLVYLLFQGAFTAFKQIDQAGSILALALSVTSLVTFVFSIFIIPSIFYFSKDGEILLSLPLRAETIFASKFTVCLLFEYAFTLFIGVPAFVAYMTTTSIPLTSFIFAIIILLLLPMYPLVLSSIIVMLIMRFVPFFKNRDRFNMIAGFASVVIAISFNLVFTRLSDATNANSIISSLTSGHNSLINILSYSIPGVPFAARAFISGDVFQLLVFILITVIALCICLFLGKLLYFKGLIGFSETSAHRKKISERDMDKLSHQKNRILTYAAKELKTIIRTPIFLMNSISSAVIFPVIIIVLPMFEGNSFSSSGIPDSISTLLQGFWPYMIIAGVVLGIFFGNLNMISSTCVSREGSNVMFMKYIPMPLKDQLHAKTLAGISVSILSLLLMMIAIHFLVPFVPLPMLLLVFVVSLLSTIMANYIGLYIDMLHPKLVWANESAAMKQNMSSAIAMLGGIALGIVIGVIAVLIPSSIVSYVSILFIIVLIVINILLYLGVDRVAKKVFPKY